MIKAIIFDFDGTIFDTETPEYLAFWGVFKQYGLELPLEVWGRCVGTDSSVFNPYEYLEQCLNKPIIRDEIRALRRDNYARLILNENIRPGVKRYLEEAKRLGLKVGLASSSSREWVMKYLRQLEIAHYFDCIRVKDDVTKVKPDPELYYQVLHGLQILPEEAIAIEDSPNGARAAKQAGLYCLIVPNTITKDFAFDAVDLRLSSLLDMELDDLVEKWSRAL